MTFLATVSINQNICLYGVQLNELKLNNIMLILFVFKKQNKNITVYFDMLSGDSLDATLLLALNIFHRLVASKLMFIQQLSPYI